MFITLTKKIEIKVQKKPALELKIIDCKRTQCLHMACLSTGQNAVFQILHLIERAQFFTHFIYSIATLLSCHCYADQLIHVIPVLTKEKTGHKKRFQRQTVKDRLLLFEQCFSHVGYCTQQQTDNKVRKEMIIINEIHAFESMPMRYHCRHRHLMLLHEYLFG